MTLPKGLLLDTCAVIWIATGEPVSDLATNAIKAAFDEGQSVAVSAMTAWEMGMLVSKNRLPSTKPPLRWFEDFVDASGVSVSDLTPQILVSSSFLPEPIHSDPMDRIIIATAREHDLTIVTRDRAILAYGAAGHVKTLAC